MVRIMHEWIKPLITRGRGNAKVLILSKLSDEPKLAYEIYIALKEEGFPIAISTLYTVLKELEKEGLAKVIEENMNKRYVITEKGKEYLNRPENLSILRKYEENINRLRMFEKIGLTEFMKTLKELFYNVDRLSEEKLEKLMKIIKNTDREIRDIMYSLYTE